MDTSCSCLLDIQYFTCTGRTTQGNSERSKIRTLRVVPGCFHKGKVFLQAQQPCEDDVRGNRQILQPLL